MKFHARRLVQAVLLLNMLFWLWFWIDVSRHTKLYTDREPKFEESVPIYKFGTKALPPEAERDLSSFRSMLFCQRPSFFVVARTVNSLSAGPWNHRLGALSIGAYALIGTMLLSFAQWGLVALLINRVVVWVSGGRGTTVHRPA
jgi:hypothetical protein